MRSLLLCRHGETEWNRDGRLQGRDDSPLTPRGLAQAEALARAAAARGVGRVLTSPLGRARTTAERVAAACGASLEVHDALVELSFGDCGGLTMAQIDERFPGFRATREHAHWTTRWPNGESYADATTRIAAWLEAQPAPWSDPPAAIISHGAVTRALLHVLTGAAPDTVRTAHLASGGAIELREDGSHSPLAELTGAEGLERDV